MWKQAFCVVLLATAAWADSPGGPKCLPLDILPFYQPRIGDGDVDRVVIHDMVPTANYFRVNVPLPSDPSVQLSWNVAGKTGFQVTPGLEAYFQRGLVNQSPNSAVQVQNDRVGMWLNTNDGAVQLSPRYPSTSMSAGCWLTDLRALAGVRPFPDPDTELEVSFDANVATDEQNGGGGPVAAFDYFQFMFFDRTTCTNLDIFASCKSFISTILLYDRRGHVAPPYSVSHEVDLNLPSASAYIDAESFGCNWFHRISGDFHTAAPFSDVFRFRISYAEFANLLSALRQHNPSGGFSALPENYGVLLMTFQSETADFDGVGMGSSAQIGSSVARMAVASKVPHVATFSPTGFQGNGTQRVNYRSDTGEVNEFFWDPAVSRWKNYGLSRAAGAVSAAGRPFGYRSNTDRVVYRGVDSHVYELWVDGSGWHSFDMSSVAGAGLATGDPMGYVDSAGISRVVYRGSSGRLFELRLERGYWEARQLSQFVQLTAAASNPRGFVLGSVPGLVYRDINNGVVVLRYEAGRWSACSLSAACGGFQPVASGDPMGLTDEAGVPHVVYRSETGGLIESHLEGTSWVWAELVSSDSGHAVAGNPVAYIGASATRIVYRSSDNHVRELMFNGAWVELDLTSSVVGALAARADPVPFIGNGVLQVAYRAADNRLHEFKNIDGSWYHYDF